MKIKKILIKIYFKFTTIFKIKFVYFIVFHLFYLYWKFISKRYRIARTGLNKSDLRLFFGPSELLNNYHWCNAMKDAGYNAKTIINELANFLTDRKDFDLTFDDVMLNHMSIIPLDIRYKIKDIIVFDYILKNFDVVHKDMIQLAFKDFKYMKYEAKILKMFGIKIIVIPYGSDFLQYSIVRNYPMLHTIMSFYPHSQLDEDLINKRTKYWAYNSDILIGSNVLDGKWKWDLIPFVNLCIDTVNIPEKKYNYADGIDGEVVVGHSPNHRLIKGTEFIIKAINELKEEGLKIKFILIENKKNTEVRRLLQEEIDILVEEVVCGYALSGLEGMAHGLPVLSNLSNEEYTRMYRRYSYLNECPILSSTPENVKNNLRILILNPSFRISLGKAGKLYCEKYHSRKAAQFMFEKIYDKIIFNKEEIKLYNLYHPAIKNSYNNSMPLIEHPLHENKIPDAILKTLRTHI